MWCCRAKQFVDKGTLIYMKWRDLKIGRTRQHFFARVNKRFVEIKD